MDLSPEKVVVIKPVLFSERKFFLKITFCQGNSINTEELIPFFKKEVVQIVF